MHAASWTGGLSAQKGASDRERLQGFQREKLRDLLENVLPLSRFYGLKLRAAGLGDGKLPQVASLDDLRRFPFTTKAEIQADQEANPPYGTNLTQPIEKYTRLHQTSGTAGRPIRWLDTPESWSAILTAWEAIYRAAGIGAGDRLFFPFSFGPFLGFWAAFESAQRLGLMVLPGGGLSTAVRLRFIEENRITVVLCTPTYALRLAEAAREAGWDPTRGSVRAFILAGEPGGSIPSVRSRIEEAWGARCFDHWGMTEVGPLALEAQDSPGGLSIIESHCIPEVVDPKSGQPVPPGTRGELVITTLKREGSPLLRYRTGDLVVMEEIASPDGSRALRLRGGIIGRADDMILVRGNNVYPSAVEAVIRGIRGIAEYQVLVSGHRSPGTELRLQIEPGPGTDGAALIGVVKDAFHSALFFRPEVEVVAAGSLPRFEMKARRFCFAEEKSA